MTIVRLFAVDATPLTVENDQAIVQAVACIDKDEAAFNWTP